MDIKLRTTERAARAGDPGAIRAYVAMVARLWGVRDGRRAEVEMGVSPVSDFAERLRESYRSPPRHRVFFAARFAGEVNLSIQAGYGLYSSPRRLLAVGDHSYSEWELGSVPAALPTEVAGMVHWEGAALDGFTVAPYVTTECVQRMLDALYVEHGAPTWDGSEPPDGIPPTGGQPETSNPHAGTVVEFEETNSGGSYRLSEADYAALIAAGWVRGEGWRGQPGRTAIREGLSQIDAIQEWERITGRDAYDPGCECCGAPFYFS